LKGCVTERRWVKSLPNVQVVLSGMNNLEQMQNNVKTFSETAPITTEEQTAIDRVVKTLVDLVPCTACRYCREGCPALLDIPKLIGIYNEVRSKTRGCF
jgi:predicted aldo/keto reductase-like oxidoreductase